MFRYTLTAFTELSHLLYLRPELPLTKHFHLMDSGDVGDGPLDLMWHAGNENKHHYDIFLQHIGAVKAVQGPVCSLWYK